MAALRKGGAATDRAAAAATASASIRAPRFTVKPSKQTCFILGGTAGALVIACVGLYVWQTSQMTDIQKQIDDKRTEVASGQKIAAQLAQVESDFTATQSQLRFLETSVTENQYVPTLLHQMEGLAKSTNLQVNSVRPTFEMAPKPDPKKAQEDGDKKAPPPPPYDMIHIDMEVRGSYWDVAKMCYRLTEFPKIMQVDSVQLAPQGATAPAQSPPLGVHLRLTGFIFPNDGTAASSAAMQPLPPPNASTLQPSAPAPAAPSSAAPAPPQHPGPQTPQQRAMSSSVSHKPGAGA